MVRRISPSVRNARKWVYMNVSAFDSDQVWQRIERLQTDNVRLREDLRAEVSRFPRSRNRDLPPIDGRRLNDLTPREVEVLHMIAKGHSTKDLADRLGIAFKTAACHRHRLMQKLEVHTTSSLVRIAMSAGLVEA